MAIFSALNRGPFTAARLTLHTGTIMRAQILSDTAVSPNLAAGDAVTRDDIQEVLHRFPFSAHSTIAVGPLAELSAAK